MRNAGIGPRRYGVREHAELLVDRLADEHDLRECRDPALVAEAVEVARAYVADPPLPEPRLTALGIADLNPPNVLWDGRVARLVDFEDGGLSDPAYGSPTTSSTSAAASRGCTTPTHWRTRSASTRRVATGWRPTGLWRRSGW